MSSYQVDRLKWSKMSIFEQMGNIYSEVGRSFNANRSNNIKQRDEAVTRALDLFDATVEGLISQNSPRSKEVLRSKDQFLQVIYGDLDEAGVDRYFLQYAIAARKNT